MTLASGYEATVTIKIHEVPPVVKNLADYRYELFHKLLEPLGPENEFLTASQIHEIIDKALILNGIIPNPSETDD